MSLHLKTVIVVVFLISLWPLCSTEPSFRIIAPQTICKHENNGSLTSNPQAVVVGLQPRDGMKLSYKVRIFFKSTASRVRSQRNTLLVWKAIRSLENRINVKERMQISKQNMFSINKTEVEPGVIYMFHIVGITDAGEVSKQQLFTMKYTDGVLERNETKAGLNFLLIGAESTVASIPYTITARVSFCKPRYDYYLRWKMLGLDEEFQDVLHTTGTVLKIPPNSLIAGKEYEVQATVIQSDNSLELAQDFITVQVMKRGFQAYIIPTAVKIGLNKPAIFEVFIQEFDNNCEELDIIWECTANDGGKCPPTETVNSTKFEFVFKTQGSYEISATLKLGELTRSIRAEVTIDPTVYLSFEFSNIPSLVPSAGQALQFSVLMVDLIPNCKAGWSTAQEEGFVFIPPEEIGDGFATVEIKDLEKEYLSEIADFGNSTSNKEIVLNIPTASGKWQGLKGDANYKFRLDTVCPGPYDPNDVESVKRKVVSSFEFVVYTNSPPIGGELHVKPLNGSALQTVFEISSDSAKDLLLDGPLSYEFIIQVGQYNISLGKFYEFKSLDTQLPYSDPSVKVMSRVCDIRGACNINLGPIVKVDPIEYSQEETELIENRIREAFERTDFNEAQNLMLMAGLTYKNSPNTLEVFEKFKTFATNLLRKEIDKQYESPTEKYYISKEDVVNFISQTKVNLEILDIKDPGLLEKLLDLLDLAAEENNDGAYANIENFRRRKKRNLDSESVVLPLEGRSIIDAAYVRMNLNLIEKIMQSYSGGNMQKEKSKLAQKIPVLASKMCNSDLITKESIYSSIAAIDVEKMTGSHLIEKTFTIANYFAKETGHYQIKIPKLKSRVKYYCVAFIQFPEDYFDGDKQFSYRIQIIDLATSLPIKEVESPSESTVVGFKMSRTDNKNDICLMRKMLEWSPEFCSTKQLTDFQILCECRNFGFVKTGKRQNYIQDDVVTIGSLTTNPLISAISPPSDNIINKPTTNEIILPSSPSPTLPTTADPTTLSQSPPTKPPPKQPTAAQPPPGKPPLNTKDKDSEERIVTASPLSYIIPLIGLLLILLVIGAVIFYRRRKRSILGNSVPGFDIMVTYPREPRPGLKYAKFYDEHLMTGNFNNPSES
ncbi:uncharacterized protein LOC129914922 [Episyrphus balteatus]|uniref:uncharacterized protein LOC129914922 n=1 Tax=Episyrphus balteatus TaxID=286459 RepID=UPI0024862B43|nr:uncharacterized protein LOC129914922 [Episyrphus balteatus]